MRKGHRHLPTLQLGEWVMNHGGVLDLVQTVLHLKLGVAGREAVGGFKIPNLTLSLLSSLPTSATSSIPAISQSAIQVKKHNYHYRLSFILTPKVPVSGHLSELWLVSLVLQNFDVGITALADRTLQ